VAPSWNDLIEEAKNSGTGFDPLPVGRYDVKIAKSAHKTSQTGKSMYEVEMTIINGPHANRKCWDRYVVTPDNGKALAFFFQKMKILGLGPEYFAGNPSDDAVAAALVDRICTVELGQTEYNGATRNEVRKLLPLTGAATGAPPVPAATAAGAPPVPAAPPVAAAVVPPVITPPVAAAPVVPAPAVAAEVPVVPVVPAPVVATPEVVVVEVVPVAVETAVVAEVAAVPAAPVPPAPPF
jgi:hypothetical protein